MSPWVAGAGLALLVGAYTFGRHDGRQLEVASQAKAQRIAAESAEAMTTAAVEAIKGIKPVYQTINKGVERETRTEIRYSDCRHSPDAWRLLDSAYQAAGGQSLGGGAGLQPAAGSGG